MYNRTRLAVACAIVLATGMSSTQGLSIIPLGDSITAGGGSWSTGGYRGPLYTLLTDSSYLFDFVGSQNSGNIPDADNEGHSGWSANSIRDNVIAWLQTAPAEIILLHIGTNDIVGGQSPDEIVVETGEIFDNIYSADPNAIVIVAQIVNRQTYDSAVTTYNTLLSDLVSNRISDGDRLILVGMESALVYPDDMSNDAHPNEFGYTKMALAWFDAIECVTDLNPAQVDTDSNRIGNSCDSDDDGDRLLDSIEVAIGTNSLIQDTDGDGLIDGDEVLLHETDPLLVDTDADGYSDGREVTAGTNPLDNQSTFLDVASDINDDGQIDVGDLMLGSRILTDLHSPTVLEQARFDIAPLLNGESEQNN